MEQEKASQRIMTKPLPSILDELEAAIEEAKLAARESREAALVAHEAAGAARKAGLDAGLAAHKAAEEAVAKVARETADEISQVKILAQDAMATANAALTLASKTRKAIVDAQNVLAEEI